MLYIVYNIVFLGINLRSNGTGVQESPTSDYVDDSTSEPGESTCSSVNSASPVPTTVPPPKNKHPHHIPYDPQVSAIIVRVIGGMIYYGDV